MLSFNIERKKNKLKGVGENTTSKPTMGLEANPSR